MLEWAETAEDLDELRKKTAEHFHEGNIHLYNPSIHHKKIYTCNTSYILKGNSVRMCMLADY